MAIRTVLQLGDPRLREICRPVCDPAAPEISTLVQDMVDTLAACRRETGYGRAIAAPQIGESVRLVLLHLPGSEPWPLVNPTIVRVSEETRTVWDLCLSFLCIAMQVERHCEITVRYQDLAGAWHEVQAGAERELSELLQHEIDHLDGILAIDRVSDVKTICTRDEFEKRYRVGSPYGSQPV